MKSEGLDILLVDASVEPALGLAKRLFRSYAAEWSATIAETLCFQGFEEELAKLPGRYAPPSGCLLMALEGDRPAGCVAMRDLGGGTCEMKRLYVAPEYRGRGAGSLLVIEVIRIAETVGHRRMVLDTLPEMVGAIALYRAHGFVETDRYWDHPIEQAIFLEKTLDEGMMAQEGVDFDGK